MTLPPIQNHMSDQDILDWMDMFFAARVRVYRNRVDLICEAMADDRPVGICISIPRYWSVSGATIKQGKLLRPFKRLLGRDNRVVLHGRPELTFRLVEWVCNWSIDEPQYQEGWAEKWDPTWRHPPGRISFSAAHLSDQPCDAAKRVLKLKLFHESAPYFELFLNFDPTTNTVSLNEKDPEFRQATQVAFAKAFQQEVAK